MLGRPALGAINAYERYVSPRKGYGCAYRLAHCGARYSGFAKHAIADLGTLAALPKILKRFAACKQAALTLSDDRNDDGDGAQKKQEPRWYDYCDSCAGCYCPRGKSSPPIPHQTARQIAAVFE
jgi:putative component of membrane protein insertase Oxa1/YidC/SpoIIIJ protein YidD